MKRILFVSESLGRGGMERVLVDIANALAENGYDVSIILYDTRNDLESELDPAIRLIYKPRKPLKLMRSLPYFHRFFNKDKWEKRASPRTLYRYYVGRSKYDVEVAFYRGPSIKIISGSTNRKSRKIAWVHTDFKRCDPKSITKFFSSIDEAQRAYASFDRVACVSSEAKNSFDEVIPSAKDLSTVVYNMIPSESIIKKASVPCPIEKKRFTFSTVGRLIPDKGYDRLIKAVKRLNEDGYSFDVWLIGGGRAEEELKNLAESEGTHNVVFIGMQDNPYKYEKESDMFVCSSKREGFSIAIAEAMTLGIPIISTDCAGQSDMLGENKYGIVVESSEDGIYNGMKSVLDGNYDLADLSQKSLERSAAFEKKEIIKTIESLFEIKD